MLIIAHRGNTAGPEPASENTTAHVAKAIGQGFDVEVDVWLEAGRFSLGHDGPGEPVSEEFLKNPRLWCHAKTADTLVALLGLRTHCFFHDADAAVFTSRRYVIAHVNTRLAGPHVICMLPEVSGFDPAGCRGVCTDYPHRFL